MKTTRRLFALTCALLILLFLPMNAYAAGAPDAASTAVIPPEDSAVATTTVNEFDMINTLKSTPEEQLLAQGYTQQQIAEIQEFSFDQALLERAQYSETQLYNIGYTTEEIALLKAYAADPSQTLSYSETRSLTAELSGTASVRHASGGTIAAKYDWEWDKQPFFSGSAITDKIACGWKGIASDSSELAVKINSPLSRSSINYYGCTTGTLRYIATNDVNVLEYTSSASADIPLCGDMIEAGQVTSYAKSGYLIVYIEPVIFGTSLGAVSFTFCYAHTYGPINISFSFAFSNFNVSIDVPNGHKLDHDPILIYSNGNYTTP